jgi:hypothetical protein
MLYNFFITFKFHRFCQSGCYFDFFYKKLTDVFVRNVFVYTSQFFAEKYMIEVLTKKIIDKSIFNINKIIGFTKLNFFTFFLQTVYVFFYSLSLFNLFFIIF